VAVGKSIEQLMGGIGFFSLDFGKVDERSDKKALGFADMAVLFRTARQGEQLADTLAAAGIPCQLTTAGMHSRSDSLQVVLSAFRLLEGVGSYIDIETAGPSLCVGLKPREIKPLTRWGIDHDCSIHQVLETARRLPMPGLGKNSQRKIWELIRRLEAHQKELANSTVPEKLERLVRTLHLTEHDDGVKSIPERVSRLFSAGGPVPDPLEWISQMTLQTDTDRYDSRVEKVALLTMHAAKGLEFPVVFVVGCEDDLIPLRLPQKEESDIDEERRLFYVAMTRARDLLFLTYCRKRTVFGRHQVRRPSPFLVDIENRLKSFENPSSKAPSKIRAEQLRLF
jgi:superfamily I DNA/RNA helicase